MPTRGAKVECRIGLGIRQVIGLFTLATNDNAT
jgi:hypothetical protein